MAAAATDAELIFNPVSAFIDFTVEENRRLFVSDRSTPAYVGTDGALAFGGVRPSVYLTIVEGDGLASNFAQNKGVGGAFAVVT